MKTLAYSYLIVSHLIYLGTIYVWWELLGSELIYGYSDLAEGNRWSELSALQFPWYYLIIVFYPILMIAVMVACWWLVESKRKWAMWLNSIPLVAMLGIGIYAMYVFHFYFGWNLWELVRSFV
ncbi:hypothetical protein MKY84_05365 [Chryseomicrobium sp. FSL W7-1435]|uniref:hypothetical protein n=1 Tax=Chryseomicrobium sp. FSL W7-1435 TaxID=2921704 RepID=UPI00315B05A2